MGAGLGVVSAAIGGALLYSAYTVRGYAAAVAQVGNLTSATADELDKLDKQGRITGRNTADNIDEIGAAMVELAKHKFTPSEIGRELGGINNLADALSTDMATAARVAGGTLQSFRLDAAHTAEVTDYLALSALRSGMGLEELAAGLHTVAPLAVAAGAGLKDTLAQLVALKLMGFDGAEAGTALAAAYKNIAKSEVNQYLKSLGVDARDSSGNLKSLTTILNDIAAVGAKLGSGARLQLFEKIFGKGVAGASALASGVAPLKKFQAELDNAAGTAANAAERIDKTIGKQMDKLKNAVRGPAVELGHALTPALTDLNGVVGPVMNALSGFIALHKDWIDKLVRLYPLLPAVAGGLYAMGVAANVMGGSIKNISATLGLFHSLVMIAFNPAFWTIAGIAVLVAALGGLTYYLLRNTEAWASWKSGLSGIFELLTRESGTAFDAIKTAISGGDLQGAWEVFCTFLNMKWTETWNAVYDYWAIIKNGLQNSILDFAESFAIALVRAVEPVKLAWAELAGFFERLWNGILDKYVDAQNAIIKLYNKIPGVELPLIPKTQNADTVNQQSRDKQSAREAQITDMTQIKIQQIRQGIGGQQAANDAELQKTLKESSEIVKRSAAEFHAAVDKVNQNDLLRRIDQELIDAFREIDAPVRAAAQAASGAGELAVGYGASGSFLAGEAQQASSGGGIQKQMLDTSTQIASNTREIANAARNGLAFV
ncbi:MAG: phage tail tape measure protein [Victivallaceae bacterium]